MIKIFRKNLTARDWALMALAVCFIVAQVFLDLTMPDYMSEMTKLVQTEGSQMQDIFSAGGMMLLCALGSLVSAVIVAIIAGYISAGFGARVRERQFDKVQAFSMAEVNRFSTASLITRSTNDVTQIQMLLVMGMQAMIKAPIMAVWAVTKIAGKNGTWTIATGVAVIVLLIVVGIAIALALPKFRKLQVLTDNLNRIARENLTGLEVVRAYNAEEYQENKFTRANDELTSANLYANRVMATMMPSINLIMSGLTLSIYWLGAIMINEAEMMDKITFFSDMVVFSQYALQVVMSFMLLVMVFIILPRASVSAKRINEVLDTELSIENGKKEFGYDGEEGNIEFKNVSFRYPDAEADVLHDISFSAKRGETVAIIGSTGCGKSTLVTLIPRFYDATDGEVLVDGRNVREYEEHSLRNKIGYVTQKALLFGGTIRSNIAYGENGGIITDEAVINAVEAAQATEFVEAKENNYDMDIAQAGANLSGGQKQRISIARALARKPEILIFDDSFSALDYKTDRALRKALETECKDTTKVIVAQRIGTIRNADQILVLEDGQIVGRGRHDELMKNCPVYQEIALSQLSKEEL